jgi:hypothetical protein
MRKAAVLGEKYPLSLRGLEPQRGKLDRSSASRTREKYHLWKWIILSQIVQ